MDIIDIMLARAMTPQGKTEAYVAKANKAAQKAAQAEANAAAAIATVEDAADEIATAREEAAALLEEAQDVLETAQEAQINMPEAYTTTGQNTDGYMTQKAVTDALTSALATKADVTALADKVTTEQLNTALADKADASTAATKAYVNQKIAEIPASSGSGAQINLDVDDAGHIIVIDDDGHIIAGAVTENLIINALLDAGAYNAKNAVGLDMDYANKAFTRIQQAVNKTMGSDFNAYPMYGGRMKCNVADDGTINAFYGDSNYTEDGSNGQVMVYQPKFYYRRTPHLAEELVNGQIIRHESLIISATEQPGFKLAPIFKGDLDYVLLPAYDGSLMNNKLASIAGATPLNNVTVAQAEAYARARGDGWHIMTLAAEATNQMLEIVEFGMMNGQTALEQGITYNPGNGVTCLFITGSTAALGNGTGHAESSQAEVGGSLVTLNTEGQRAICYRGMENPWGHLWQLLGGINVKGTGGPGGGTPYICTDFDYTPNAVGDNYDSVGFALPSTYKWISAMGIGNTKYDWAFLPIECSSSANSLLPVGDSIWTVNGLNGVTILASGGSYGYGEECGPFYYAADRAAADTARNNYGVKLLYIPTKNNIYTANIAKWNNHMGG